VVWYARSRGVSFHDARRPRHSTNLIRPGLIGRDPFKLHLRFNCVILSTTWTTNACDCPRKTI
jgi:hypothetical protein